MAKRNAPRRFVLLNNLDDRRAQSLRTDVDEMAYISASGSNTRCRIANMSDDGAALEVPDASFIPNCFQLMTERDRIVQTCKIVWIKQNRIGVELTLRCWMLT